MRAQQTQCLDFLRVIEVASGPGGAYCGRLLSTLGADVIKVEAPGIGDVTRAWGPFANDVPDPDRGLLFLNLNVNKRGVTLDVYSASGLEVLRRLAVISDVLILEEDEQRLSQDAIDSLRITNPRLIVGVMRPFGMSGPYAEYEASGLNLFQAGGSGYLIPAGLSYFLNPDGQPLDMAGESSLEHCGIVAAAGIMAAYHARDWSGGQVVDCSEHEAHLAISRQQLTWYASDQLYEKRESYHTAFGGCIPCKDGFVELYAVNEGEWRALKGMLGDPDWAQSDDFRDGVERAAHADIIQPKLLEWAADLSREDIYRLAQRWGSPTAYFATPAEVCASTHENARGFFESVTHPISGTMPYATLSFKPTATPVRLTRAAPRLGEHNAEVFRDLLGVSGDQMTRLSRLGVM